MAQSTVDIQKMRSVSAELDKNYTSITTQLKKLEEQMALLAQLWKGEGASAFQAAYRQNAQNFAQLSAAVRSCSISLSSIAANYGKADTAAADMIKSKMGGR